MKIQLLHKLFAAFLMTSFMIVALMVAIMHFYVGHNFLEYVNKMEMEKLDAVVDLLAEEYAARGNWGALSADPGRWTRIIRSAGVKLGPEGPLDIAPPPLDRHGPPPPPSHSLHAKRDPFDQSAPQDPVPPPGPGEAGGPGAPPPPPLEQFRGPHSFVARLLLLDSEHRPVAGADAPFSPDTHTLHRIVVDGKTAGWLALRKHPEKSDPIVTNFLRRQYDAFILTGGCIMLLAAVVSFLMARHLLAPIRRLMEGTQALGRLQFDTRIPVSTGDELGQLATAFNLMAHTLEQYEHMRKQWISDISHELRTPLAILRGEIEALQDGIRNMGPGALESLHTETLHLIRIVDDLHELSLADSGALHISREPVRPTKILKDTTAVFKTRFDAAHITIHEENQEDAPFTLRGDEKRLTQLFSNLLENTLKYTDSPGTLRVRQATTREHWEVSFEDSAPGVPHASLERLFDRLYQVDSARMRSKGGSGLGLAICKAIVEDLGGSIRAAHGSEGGLKIEIRLPSESHVSHVT